MGDVSAGQDGRKFLAAICVGDVCHGTVVAVSRSEMSVTLDGFPAHPLGSVGTLDCSWRRRFDDVAVVGRRIAGEVLAVDLDAGRVRLSMAATENPELWGFLKRLGPGELLTGTVVAIEPFGVFVALDDGPDHPVHPGVGFITYPELSWTRIEAASDVVGIGQRVSCEFLQFDTWNGEARLSLRATRADPFLEFADGLAVGDRLSGRVTRLVPFGAFVRVADGVEGLVQLSELGPAPVAAPEDVVQVGDQLTVVVLDVDRERRRISLSRQVLRQA
ncbi:S1 RNA-binding domain-containing protein [Streptomyces sp. S.PB5]|uniref:S1 RNA-binding domain-containing protein n=1 Tax=Streptomyces sp. S.PB5 TaxID=3020844 RepID=UPI0025B15DB4|nr:S1 RNA-binding domain-containing protein [Streptomyces sp. S.PB5]MDN3022924.1 S1 RNA-binding domain-containing protein [Streptomyces sp. S.PB5]